MMKILIGSAWPYANGSLHIGHIAALLPADILARYHRAKGDDVYFVSGSDCHGTPVAIRAKQENRSPQEISDYYHHEFCDCFEKLGFRYDLYTKTSSEEHKSFVSEFHRKMYESQYVFERSTPQAYCTTCQSYLADRFIVGECPSCGAMARGDQCDCCGSVLEPENLIHATCSVCGNAPVYKETKHLFLAVSKLENSLNAFIEAHPNWRKNAVSFSNRYLSEGLRDRAITRDLKWGIQVPKDGYEDKSIYIWAENVLGYLSASKVAADLRNESFRELWGADVKHYYVHGKDNIPFHTIILPALLMAHGDAWHLPDEIVSSEYLTLEGRKISTSQNYAIWVKDIVGKYHPDSLRYFLLSNGPEKRDANFSWLEYVNSHNAELVGAYGNFVNRTLAFIAKYFDGIVPDGSIDREIEKQIGSIYDVVGKKIEQTKLKDAMGSILEFVHQANRFFDTEKPWITRTTDIAACKNTLFNCVQIIANLAVLYQPFLVFSSEKVRNWCRVSEVWKPQFVAPGLLIGEREILFERIDKAVIDYETQKLHQNTCAVNHKK